LFTSIFGTIGAVLAAAVLLGAAFSVFRASDLRNTVSDQKTRIESLITDRNELRNDLTLKDAAIELLTRRLELVEERSKNLEEIVSGRIDFSKLENALAHHNAEVMRRLTEIEEKMLNGQRDIKALLNAHRAADGGGA
jgi:predicted nuclease with TOPRIM domain